MLFCYYYFLTAQAFHGISSKVNNVYIEIVAAHTRTLTYGNHVFVIITYVLSDNILSMPTKWEGCSRASKTRLSPCKSVTPFIL